jgi:hypothetical protein
MGTYSTDVSLTFGGAAAYEHSRDVENLQASFSSSFLYYYSKSTQPVWCIGSKLGGPCTLRLHAKVKNPLWHCTSGANCKWAGKITSASEPATVVPEGERV